MTPLQVVIVAAILAVAVSVWLIAPLVAEELARLTDVTDEEWLPADDPRRLP